MDKRVNAEQSFDSIFKSKTLICINSCTGGRCRSGEDLFVEPVYQGHNSQTEDPDYWCRIRHQGRPAQK